MKHGIRICLFLLTVFAITACTDSRKVEIIRQAEQMIQEQPDSALHLLQGIDRHTLRGKTLARYALVYSIAQDKSGLDVSSDSLLRIAYEYYCQHPEDSLYARSQYYMGLYLCLTAQEDSAYSCLLKAKKASEENKEYYTAYLVTDRMRRIAEVSDTAMCLMLAKDAYRLYQKHGTVNPVNEVYLLIGIGDGYYRCSNQDSTLHYYNEALNRAKETGDSIVISSVLQNISRYYNYYHQSEKAFEYAQQAVSYRRYLNKSLLTLLAQCYIENAEYNKAQQYINTLPSNDSKKDKLVKLSIQHRLSTKTGDADASQAYFDSAIDVAADMYLSTQKDKLELHRKNLHETLERQRAEYQRTIFVICFLFSVALIILISWLFIKYHRARKVEKARMLAEEAMLRQDKEHKEHMMNQTRFYVKKMIGILRKLEEHRREKKRREEYAKEINPKDNNVKKIRIRMKIDEKEWDELQAYLEACDDSFVTRFKQKYPSISTEDYRLCLLLRCGFTNSDLEMVYLNGMQVIKNKQNLAKDRLGIIEKNLSLRQYIMQF